MRLRIVSFATVALLIAMATPAHAQAKEKPDINDWINGRIDSLVAGRIMQNDRGKTPQLPAGSPSRASIIDRANLPDVAGISIALPNQSAPNGGALPPSMSLGTSPYMLLALANSKNPLDPATYLSSRWSRKVGLSTTWDTDPSTGKSLPTFQAKILLIDRKNPLSLQSEGAIKTMLTDLDEKLALAAKFYG